MLVVRVSIFAIVVAVSRLGAAASEPEYGEKGVPRPGCQPSDVTIVMDFEGDSVDARHRDRAWLVVRYGRACRFRRIILDVYGSGPLAERRATALKEQFTGPSWPYAVETRYRNAGSAPKGDDWEGSWNAGIAITFSDRDPNWEPPLRSPPAECTYDPVTQTTPCKTLPWPIAKPFRLNAPPFAQHMPTVIFDANIGALNDEGRAVIREAMSRFREANYRVIFLTSYAEGSNSDPTAISMQRAIAVRDEFLRLGVAADAISIRTMGAAGYNKADEREYPWIWRQVTIEASD